MKEIKYDDVPSGEIAKDQHMKAKFIYDQISNLQNSEASEWSYIILLRNIINNRNLDLIKYVLNLHTYTKKQQMEALDGIGIYESNLHIMKYFAEKEVASSLLILLALGVARHRKDIDMIKYFESKVLN